MCVCGYDSSIQAGGLASTLLARHRDAVALQDEVIHADHGRALLRLAPHAVEPLWADDSTHQDLECCPQYSLRLREFVATTFKLSAL
jgi:hypothetical protein